MSNMPLACMTVADITEQALRLYNATHPEPTEQDMSVQWQEQHRAEQVLASACVCASPNDGLVLILSGE